MSYDLWERALAGEKVKHHTQPDENNEGRFRIPVKEPVLNAAGKTNGQKRIVGWTPVAYYLWEGKLVGSIGAGLEQRNMTDNEVIDLWTWCCNYPISNEIYSAVAERGEPWPDLQVSQVPDGSVVAAASVGPSKRSEGEATPPTGHTERIIDRTHNAPPEVLPEVAAAEAIDNAIGAAKDLKVTTVEEAAQAAGAANVIRDRRLAVEKTAKAKVEPLQRIYENERNKWLPLVKRAKDAEDAVRTKVADFEASERRRIAKEQLEALEKQRLIDEENQRIADRAIAAGIPEPAPVVEEVVIPQAPARVTPTYGNYKPRAKPILKFAVIEDAAKVIDFYKLNHQFIELIQKLATADIRAGLEVPGATFREGES